MSNLEKSDQNYILSLKFKQIISIFLISEFSPVLFLMKEKEIYLML